MYNPLDSISLEERLNFSSNFGVTRPTILDEIFPDKKTQFWKAEYYRLMTGSAVPKVALVHALDTEARIGRRPGFERVLTEKLFIKEKLNQSEKLRQAIENGVPESEVLTDFVFNDSANLFEAVLARTKVMKGQVMSDGAIDIDENNVKMTIDFGVPSENKVSLGDWSNPDYDIMGDLQKMVDIATDNGYVVNRMITSLKQINNMRKNKQMQVAVLGASNERLLTKAELATLLMQEYELTIARCDEKFKFEKADGSLATGRYFKEDRVTLYEADQNGRFGVGLWGPTPEEEEYRQFIELTQKSFITLSMWATEDPVAKWTKASGLFIPVTPKASGMVIGTVAAASGAAELGE